MVQSYVYDSFGNIVQQNGSLENPYTYTGREFDSESGLYYYRARYYDSFSGRFISEDPVRFFDGMNFYGYAYNSPINYVDPYGLWGIYGGGGFGGGAGVDPFEDDNSNYRSGGGGIFYGSSCKGGNEGGTFGTFSEYGDIWGASVGVGPFIGLFRGDVESLSGESRRVTQHYGLFSISLIYNNPGTLLPWGVEFSGGGKGWGLGGSYSEDFTEINPF